MRCWAQDRGGSTPAGRGGSGAGSDATASAGSPSAHPSSAASRAASRCAASCPRVRASNSARNGSATPARRDSRDIRRAASSEWPPSWKKSASRVGDSTPSSSRHSSATRRSLRVRGAVPVAAARGAPARPSAEGPAVDLAARRPRQLGDHLQAGRQHVARQAVRRGRDDLARQVDVAGRRRLGDDEADEAVALGQHHRFAHRRVLAEDRLHLAELDAEAAHLHLMVDAAEKLEAAVGEAPHQVAGAVEAAARMVAEGVRHPARRGARRPPQVAAREAGTGEHQLAGDADRTGPQPAVDDVAGGAGQRAAEARLALAARHLAPRLAGGRVGGVLRRTVEVAHPQPGAAGGLQAPHQVAAQRLAGQADRAQRGRQGAEIEQRRGGGRHRVEQAHPRRRRVAGEGERVGGEDQPSPGGERGEDLEHREVEAHRGGAEHVVELGGGERLPRPGEQRRRRRVRDRHALGTAGGAGGVDEVGEVLGKDGGLGQRNGFGQRGVHRHGL